jgi:hypothetical protein
MSDEDFTGERLIVTRVELGLLALLAGIVAVPFTLGVNGLVAVGVVLATVVMVLITLLARGGPPGADGG